MKFKKENDNHVKIQTADGTWYELHKKTDIPVTRWLAAKPYQIQDELKITFAGLMLFIDNYAALAKKDNISKAELQNEVNRYTEMLRQKVLMAQDIDTIRLQLAAVFWLFTDENESELDPSVMAKKIEAMKSSTSAYNFFLRSPIPLELSEITLSVDTLLFLAQLNQVQKAYQTQPQDI